MSLIFIRKKRRNGEINDTSHFLQPIWAEISSWLFPHIQSPFILGKIISVVPPITVTFNPKNLFWFLLLQKNESPAPFPLVGMRRGERNVLCSPLESAVLYLLVISACGDHSSSLITLQLLVFQLNIKSSSCSLHTLQLVFLQTSSAFSCTEKYSGQLYTKGLNDSC